MPSRPRRTTSSPKHSRTSIWPPAGINRSIVLALFVLASTVGVFVAFPTFAAQSELKNGLGTCVSTDYSDGAHNGDPVNNNNCNGTNGQNWSWNGQITFHDTHGGTGCAQPSGGNFTRDNVMVMASCQSGATTGWSHPSWGGISHSGLCLTVNNDDGTIHPQLRIRVCDSTHANQKWSNQAAPAPPPSSSSVGQQIRDVALGEVGVSENPDGCNCGGKIDTYTQNHAEPWCNDFAQWVYYRSGHGMGSIDNYVRIGPCNSIKSWFINGARGNWYANTSYNRANHPPKAGDFINIDGGNHCAIVNFTSGGTVYSIDGNYSNAVTKVSRSLGSTSIDGWGRLKTAE